MRSTEIWRPWTWLLAALQLSWSAALIIKDSPSAIPMLLTTVSVLLCGANVPGRVAVTRRLEFGFLARIELIAGIGAALLAMLGAAAGLGVYALVIANLVRQGYLFTSCRLRAPKRERGKAESISSTNSSIAIVSLFALTYIASNVDYLVISMMMKPTQVAAYFLAFNMTLTVASRIASIGTRVYMPVVGMRDRDERAGVAMRFLSAGVPLGTALSILAVLAVASVFAVLPDQWDDAYEAAIVLASFVGVAVMRSQIGSVALSRERDRPGLFLSASNIAVTVVALAAVRPEQAVAAASAVGVAMLVGTLPWITQLSREVRRKAVEGLLYTSLGPIVVVLSYWQEGGVDLAMAALPVLLCGAVTLIVARRDLRWLAGIVFRRPGSAA